jgi:hypothetical protein
VVSRFLTSYASHEFLTCDAVQRDHRELEQYYNKIKSSSSDDEKTRWQNQFVWELARHSVA